MRNFTLLFIALSFSLIYTSKSSAQTDCLPPQTKEVSSVRLQIGPPNIAFDNLLLKWAHVNSDTTLPKLKEIYPNLANKPSEYELLNTRFLIVDRHIYELFKTGLNFGSILQKIDINSGEIVWKSPFNMTKQTNVELMNNVYINDDKNIELTGSRVLVTIPPILFVQALATRKILNTTDGTVTSEHYTPFANGGIYLYNQSGQLGSIYPSSEKNKYTVLGTYIDNDRKNVCITMRMNQDGKTLDTVSVIPSPAPGVSFVSNFNSIYPLANGNYVLLLNHIINPDNPDENIPELIFLDPDGKFINRMSLSTYISGPFVMDIKVEGDEIFLTGVTYDNLQDVSSYRNHLLIIDQNMQVKINIKGFKSLDGEACQSLNVTRYKDNKYLAFASERNSCLKYFLIESDQKVKFLKKACLTEEGWILDPNKFAYTDLGIVINGCTWRDKSKPDENFFNCTFAMDISNLIEISSVSDIATESKIQVYPNPTNGSFQIVSNSKYKILKMYDTKGQNVSLPSLTDNLFNISHLQNGIYYIEVLIGDYTQVYKIVKID